MGYVTPRMRYLGGYTSKGSRFRGKGLANSTQCCISLYRTLGRSEIGVVRPSLVFLFILDPKLDGIEWSLGCYNAYSLNRCLPRALKRASSSFALSTKRLRCATTHQLKRTLSILRSIGSVISKSNESEIVLFLSELQRGISCWIADEEEVLQENEHKELVRVFFFVLTTSIQFLFNSSDRWLRCIHSPWTFWRASNRRSRFSTSSRLLSNPSSSARAEMDRLFFTTSAEDIPQTSGYTQEGISYSDSRMSQGVERLRLHRM